MQFEIHTKIVFQFRDRAEVLLCIPTVCERAETPSYLHPISFFSLTHLKIMLKMLSSHDFHILTHLIIFAHIRKTHLFCNRAITGENTALFYTTAVSCDSFEEKSRYNCKYEGRRRRLWLGRR